VSQHRIKSLIESAGQFVLISLLVTAGCFNAPWCPPSTVDPNDYPAATKADLPGVWRISAAGLPATDGVVSWVFEPRDPFISFDDPGNPYYEGIMAAGDQAALWQWNLQTGAGSPSQLAQGRPNRRNARVDVVVNDNGTLTVEINYRRPFQDRTDLGDTDVQVRYEQLAINTTRDMLTGILRKRTVAVNAFVPLPAEEEVYGSVTLRRVNVPVVPEPVSPTIHAVVQARGGALGPYAVGQVFDLNGNVAGGGDLGEITRWVWEVYRTQYGAGNTVANRETMDVPEGRISAFTADQAGVYTVRLWATDGSQWYAGTPADVDVQ